MVAAITAHNYISFLSKHQNCTYQTKYLQEKLTQGKIYFLENHYIEWITTTTCTLFILNLLDLDFQHWNIYTRTVTVYKSKLAECFTGSQNALFTFCHQWSIIAINTPFEQIFKYMQGDTIVDMIANIGLVKHLQCFNRYFGRFEPKPFNLSENWCIVQSSWLLFWIANLTIWIMLKMNSFHKFIEKKNWIWFDWNFERVHPHFPCKPIENGLYL